ncbi:MAG TPA: serine hydrolase domain-containing protein [Ilumatobacteraceae bacterium]|nr:serine hydrolase domain-containing protein [Ilumatobacteraceae bacterium]
MHALQQTAAPEAHGMSSERLARLDRYFQQYIDKGLLTGWQLAVTRHGEVVHHTCAGLRDAEANLPVEPDTIWRIFSMTKPITAVLALQLWEEGAFELNDPLHRYLPAFRNTKVWRAGSAVAPVLEPQLQPIRLWQLMAHTSGLSYGFMWAHPVDELYRRAGYEWGSPKDKDLAGVCDDLAALPLLFQPGSEWNYSMGLDVLGRVLEVVSGQPLDQLMRTRLLDPLGMHETTWHVPEANQHRLPPLYGPMPGTKQAVSLGRMGDAAKHPPAAFMGGGGLQSTALDYHRFTQMLARGGELDGVRILSPRTVRYMASNHLPANADLTEFGRPLFSETTFDGVGFGLGVSVTIDPIKGKVPGNAGEYAWGGAASTSFFIDPVDDITTMFFTQLLPSSTHPIRSEMKQLVYQAILD